MHDPARYNYGYVVGAERVPGRFGRALRFAGEGDHVMVMDADTLRVPQFYTLMAWINTEYASRAQTILDKSFGSTVEFTPYRLELREGKLRFTTGESPFSSEQTLESNRWYYVAVVVWPYRQYERVSLVIDSRVDGGPQSAAVVAEEVIRRLVPRIRGGDAATPSAPPRPDHRHQQGLLLAALRGHN